MSTRAVLLEVRLTGSAADVVGQVDELLPERARRDREFTPVAMDGGRTWIIRCVLADATQAASLEAHPDVVGVWPDGNVAPF